MSFSRRGALLSATAALSLAVGAPPALAGQASGSTGSASGLFDIVGGLLGTVTGTLNGLLGTSQLTSLGGVTTQLQGGAVPSANTLAPVTGWLTTLSTTGGLPVELTGAASQTATLLTNPTAPDAALPVPSLDVLTSLLGQLQGTSGLDLTAVSGLSSLISALTGAASILTSGSGGTASALPVVGSLPLDTASLVPLQGLVTTLTGGSLPTGPLLSPLTGLLRQVAALPGVSTLLGAELGGLADQIDAQTGTLSGNLLTTLVGTLQSIGATPGVPTSISGVLGTLTGLLGSSSGGTTPVPVPGGTTPVGKTPAGSGGGTAGSAARVGSVRLSSVRVDRRYGRVRIALTCPITGPACKTFVAAFRGKSLAGTSPLLSIPAGGSLARYVKLDAASRRVLKRKTTTFKVSAVLPGGRLSTKSATAKLPKKTAASKRKAARR